MSEINFYYSETGEKIPLRPSDDALAIAYRGDAPPKDLDALINSDEYLSEFAFSAELRKRNIVLYKRRPAAKTSLEAFAARLLRSDQIDYVSPVYYLYDTPVIVTNEFVAAFKAEVSRATIDQLNAAHDVEIVLDENLHLGANTFLLRVKTPGLRGALDMAKLYFETGLVEYAEPDFIQVTALSFPFTPNDALFSSQWHLPRIKAQEAWDITRGDSTIILAVADQGIDIAHEDFASLNKLVAKKDFFSSPSDDDPSPEAGTREDHGTAAAGVAVADGNNSKGVTGIAPNCRLMPIRFLSSGANAIPSTVHASVIRFEADQGAAVSSNSWETSPPLSITIKNAIDDATNNGRGGKGCVIFFSAGNDSSTVATKSGPAAYSRVIAVAACNDKNVRSGYSNFGPEVSICAPSDGTSANRPTWQALLGAAFQEDGSTRGIVTTDRMGETEGYNAPSASPARDDPAGISANYTSTFGGTSSACPLAAGVAALMLSVNPNLTWQQVRYILEATADKIDAANTDAIGRYQPDGHSQWYGYGRVNAFEAVKGARSSVADGDFVQRVFVTLRRTTGNRFVSTKVIHAINARQRRTETATDIFVRSGSDGYLRAKLDSPIGPLFKEAEVDE